MALLVFGSIGSVGQVLYFWLPYFLGKSFVDPVTANLIACIYSVGMVPSGIIVNCMSNLFGGRHVSVIGVYMSILAVLLGVMARYSESLYPTSLLLVMLGCMGILAGGCVVH